MRSKAIIPLAIGLAVGVLAIKLTYDFVRNARANGVSADEVPFVRTRMDIPMAAEITPNMLEVVNAPKGLLPDGAVSDPQKLKGRVAAVLMPRGMPVLMNMLSPVGTKPGMEARIPEGYRAVAVKIDESSGVAFLIKPGSRVDVVAVMTVKRDRGTETISKTILQNVEVGAVGQELGDTADKGSIASKSVTLLVRPEDVPRLHLAASKGKILLAMRNQTDESSRRAAGTTEKKLLGEEDQSSQVAAADHKAGLFTKLFGKAHDENTQTTAVQPPTMAMGNMGNQEWTVEVVRSGEVKEVRFDNPYALQRSTSVGGSRPYGGNGSRNPRVMESQQTWYNSDNTDEATDVPSEDSKEAGE